VITVAARPTREANLGGEFSKGNVASRLYGLRGSIDLRCAVAQPGLSTPWKVFCFRYGTGTPPLSALAAFHGPPPCSESRPRKAYFTSRG